MKLFNSIMTPIDNSKEAIEMLKYVARFAVKFNSKITLLHILRLSYIAKYSKNIPTFLSIKKLTKSEVYQKIKEDYYKNNVEPLFKTAIETLKSSGVKEGNIRTKVREGFPAEEIVKEAKSGEYSCMFIKRGIDKGKIAKTTLRVIQNCYSLPIFVFGHKRTERVLNRVLVPFNGKKHSLEAVRVAKLLEKAFNSKITLLHVGNDEKVFKRVEEHVKKYKKVLRKGDIAEEIIKEALHNDYDLIIFGRRCPSLKKTLLGSVSEKVTKEITQIPICLTTFCKKE